MASTKWAAHPAPGRKTSPAASAGAKAGSIKIETRRIPGTTRGADVIVTVHYVRSKGIDDFVTNVHAADPLQLGNVHSYRLDGAGREAVRLALPKRGLSPFFLGKSRHQDDTGLLLGRGGADLDVE